MISGGITDFSEAFFESASGFTTAGSSILTDVEKLGKFLLLWRSFTHVLGGGGIIVLAVALVPNLGMSTGALFQAESFTPRTSGFIQKFKDLAKQTWLAYAGLNLLLLLLLLAGGMNVFDAVCNAFGTISTGGFYPLGYSMGTYYLKSTPHSLYFEIVTAIFMLIGAMPILRAYQFATGNFRAYWEDREVRFFLILSMCGWLLTALILQINKQYPGPGLNLRHAFFNFISIQTTTGYATQEFAHWPRITHFILYIATFIGGCTGSTAGGLKAATILVCIKQIIISIRKSVHPHAVYSIRFGPLHLAREEIQTIFGFLLVFLATYAFAVFLIFFDGYDFETTLTATLACLSTTGPGTSESVGGFGSFHGFSPFSKMVLSTAMIAGRLEVLPLIALFMKKMWIK